jgi:hypothetical protein
MPSSVPTEPTAGAALVQSDRALDHAKSGPLWLKDPRIANIIAETLEYGANQYRLYDLVLSPFANCPRLQDGSKDPLPDPRTWSWAARESLSGNTNLTITVFAAMRD